MWPFNKKKVHIFDTEEFVIPDKVALGQLAKGDSNIQMLAAQHVNWAYNYIGSLERVSPSSPIFNKHVIILTGAAVKYLEDNK